MRLPKQLSEGIALPVVGVSLTPLPGSGTGSVSASRGVVNGYSVFWSGLSVGTAVDAAAKPIAGGGFELDEMLRSVKSPEALRFAVGLPEGATLQQPGGGVGPVSVMLAGQSIASILPPEAVDAQGTPIEGMSMSVAGDVLTVTVPHPAGRYAYPLMVNPVVTDSTLAGSSSRPTNWRSSTSTHFSVSGLGGGGSVTLAGSGAYSLGEDAMIFYPIREGSEARIAEISIEVSATLEGHNGAVVLELENKSKQIEKSPDEFTGNLSKSGFGVAGECWKTLNPECPFADEKGTPENLGRYELRATGGGEGASTTALRTSVELEQEKGPEVSFDTTSPTVDGGRANILYGSGGWLGPNSNSAFEIHAKDPGTGISFIGMSSGAWSKLFPFYEDGDCLGVQCEPAESEGVIYSSGMLDGENELDGIAYDTANEGYTQAATQHIKVDATPPHNIVLSGLGPGGQVGAGEYKLSAEATDGSGSTKSSGVKSLVLYIDGHAVGAPSGSCPEGPCTAHSGTWTIFGHEYATGRHTVTVLATDNANNTSSESFTMVVHPASPVALGPGSVNPQSGEFTLSATDVSLGGGLTVGRSYGSEHLTQGMGGPLGAQWAVSLGGQESLVKQSDGSMVLTGAEGAQTIFAPDGKGGYLSPAGDANLTLSSTPCEAGQTEFMLKDAAAAATTCFGAPSGGTGEVFTPHIAKGPAATNTVTYAYETKEVPLGSKKMVTRPTEALAPIPAGVSCSPVLNAGCKALTFNYASSTTAHGEAQTEWGDVEGQLTRVYYTAYDPTSKAMKTVEVARYLYDKQGRLRVEWDPRSEASTDCGGSCFALKTYYGYDSEGHVTAVTPPGQESWGIVYGSIAGNASPAAIKVTRAPASQAVWKGEGLTNTEAPRITGTRAVGTRLAVSDGEWSGSPVVHGYQWEDCSTGSGECVPIAGATNPNYTPSAKDEGYALVAVVTATNGSGSLAASAGVSGSFAYSSQFGSEGSGNGQFRGPWGVAVNSSGDVWVADATNSRLEEFSASGEYIRQAGSGGLGNGQFKTVEGLAIDPQGHVWAVDSGGNRVEEFSATGEYLGQFGSGGWGVKTEGQFEFPAALAIDSKGDFWVGDYNNYRVEEFSSSGVYMREFGSRGTGTGQFEGVGGIATDSSGDVWVVDSSDRVQEFSPTGVFMREFGSWGSGNGQFKEPWGIAIDSEGHVWVSDDSGAQEFSSTGEYMQRFGGQGTGNGQFEKAGMMAFAPNGNLWVADWRNDRMQQWTPVKEGEAQLRSPQPGSTVEYNVPVSGAGAPHAMGAKEVQEGWAQKDLPAQATAVFPPDEPQSWPASDYERATVYYRDSTERTVNVETPSSATPNGSISTNEYNANNDVERSLSADNRAIALKEAKPAEVAKLLDTQSTYNSEGTELLSTLGPRHTVKLSNGKEVQARSHTVYSYNEGAPETGGPYRLVTKTTQGAQVEGEAEQDVRATVTSYSGQNGLGWSLRKPTSVTTDPGGLNLRRTTAYNGVTGNVTEMMTPGGRVPAPPTYSSQFGSEGSGNGQFRGPWGVAVNSSGDVWVADATNSRLEEFSASGEYIRQAGSGGLGNGQFKTVEGLAIDPQGHVWAVDSGGNRVEEFSATGEYLGQFGSGGWGVKTEGQFEFPAALAIDSKGDFWVGDYNNYRVEEFSSSGVYMREFGSRGTGTGQFEGVGGIATDSSGDVWVVDSSDRVQEFSPTGVFMREFGSWGSGNGQFKEPWGIAIDSEGHVWVSDDSGAQEFSSTGEYMQRFGGQGTGNGQFEKAGMMAFAPNGNLWVADWRNDRMQQWTPASQKKSEEQHTTQTVYYTAKEEASLVACRNHPEWANLPCQTKPAEQPSIPGLPNLPVTTFAYNMYAEPTTTTSTVPECIKVSPGTGKYTDNACTHSGTGEYEIPARTTAVIYDAAGRIEATEMTSTVGAALPKVTDKYSTATGAAIEQSTSSESLKSTFNNIGELESYTDADGNTTTYEYENGGDARLKHIDDGKGTQTYEYDTTTGMVKELIDSAAKTFTASYDVEGNLISEGYPNAMSWRDPLSSVRCL